MIERRMGDIYPLQGMVSPGIFNRIVQQGGIPEQGPGRFSVPNALRREESLKNQKPTTLEERRNSNRSLFRKY